MVSVDSALNTSETGRTAPSCQHVAGDAKADPNSRATQTVTQSRSQSEHYGSKANRNHVGLQTKIFSFEAEMT